MKYLISRKNSKKNYNWFYLTKKKKKQNIQLFKVYIHDLFVSLFLPL